MKEKRSHHAESVRAEKPQVTNSARADLSQEKQTPLFCINNGRIPRGAFSPLEIAADAMRIFEKKK